MTGQHKFMEMLSYCMDVMLGHVLLRVSMCQWQGSTWRCFPHALMDVMLGNQLGLNSCVNVIIAGQHTWRCFPPAHPSAISPPSCLHQMWRGLSALLILMTTFWKMWSRFNIENTCMLFSLQVIWTDTLQGIYCSNNDWWSIKPVSLSDRLF